jgi:hypothetical protein
MIVTMNDNDKDGERRTTRCFAWEPGLSIDVFSGFTARRCNRGGLKLEA